MSLKDTTHPSVENALFKLIKGLLVFLKILLLIFFSAKLPLISFILSSSVFLVNFPFTTMISNLSSSKSLERPNLNSESLITEGFVNFQNSCLEVGMPIFLNSSKFSVRISLVSSLELAMLSSKSASILCKTFIYLLASLITSSYPFSSSSRARFLSPDLTILPFTSTCTKSGTM